MTFDQGNLMGTLLDTLVVAFNETRKSVGTRVSL